jgi:hypothetical protein
LQCFVHHHLHLFKFGEHFHGISLHNGARQIENMNQGNELWDLAAFVMLIAPSLGKRGLNVLEGVGARHLQER